MTTLTVQIDANNRDTNVLGTSYYISQSGGVLWLGQWNEEEHVGLAWQLNVPQGATINEATFDLYVVSDDTGIGVVITVWGNDADNTAVWANTNKPTAITKTTATASFNNGDAPASGWFSAGAIGAIDITDIVQEVVDRPGWASGNYFAILLSPPTDFSTNELSIHDYSGGAGNSAKLYVDYTEGGATAENVVEMII